MAIPCYIGIDVGTQGLTALLVESSTSRTPGSHQEKSSLKVLAIGEGSYDFVPDLPDGCYEQNPSDWEMALVEAFKTIEETMDSKPEICVHAICVSGQMHGCVMIDSCGNHIGTARLWCDARNQEEADVLSELFGERIPKRLTAARYLWSLQHEPEKTQNCVAISTPAGYIAHKMTTILEDGGNSSLPRLLLGVGEASGMFPVVDTEDGSEYNIDWIKAFDEYVSNTFASTDSRIPSLETLLPKIRTAGDLRSNDESNGDSPVVLNPSIIESDGWLYSVRGLLASSCSSETGILVAPAEGDQPTALAASLIGQPGMISCSFGTSVVANMVGKSTGQGRPSLAAVDRFNAVNGQPISMVWLRNGTTYLNRMVESYGGDFEALMKAAVEAPTDCGGLLSLPFLDDEPGLNVKQGGTAMVIGFQSNSSDEDGNHRAGNVIKSAMVSVMFNLLLGTQQVEEAESDAENGKREIVLTGGLTKTPETGQILADIFNRPVKLMEAADEGGAWGAALLAKYYDERYLQNQKSAPTQESWLSFLNTVEAKEQQAFSPRADQVEIYRSMLAKYKKLLDLQSQLDLVMNGP